MTKNIMGDNRMTRNKLQSLMDRAYELALADFDYDEDNLAGYQQQNITERQDYHFEQLGGDLNEFLQKCN